MSIIQPTGIFNTSLILVLVHSSCLAKGKYIYLYVIPSSRADLMLQVGWIYTKKCSIFVHSIWVLIMCLCEDAIIGYRYVIFLSNYRSNGLEVSLAMCKLCRSHQQVFASALEMIDGLFTFTSYRSSQHEKARQREASFWCNKFLR